MIGRLRGSLISKQAPVILLDVHGVGYEVEAPMSTFYKLPAIGEEVVLHTHLVVREDAQQLFGFATEDERSLFRSLIRINGVGARLALAILSGMGLDEFVHCVLDRDIAALTRLPGVGKKTAERLLVEMRDKVEHWQPVSATAAGSPGGTVIGLNNPVSDAVNALVALGYKPHEASRMVRGIDATDLASDEIIRRALQGSVNQ